ncbi:MAG: hypothetical protein RIS45_409, partial [Planctomycetota bacterium]
GDALGGPVEESLAAAHGAARLEGENRGRMTVARSRKAAILRG